MNYIGKGVALKENNEIVQSYLEHVIIGSGSTIIHSQLRGTAENPIRIEDGAEIVDSQIESTEKKRSFGFGQWRVTTPKVVIGEGSKLHKILLENTSLGKEIVARSCTIRDSIVGDFSELRPHANLLLTSTASHANLGSEISKSILEGENFVSEHTASYLSLVAPSRYPLLTKEGKETLSPHLPNLTNIGAGTVFANYGGVPSPAENFYQSSSSLKGTALVFGAFTAVNSIIVNSYGKLSEGESLFDTIRRRDISNLGFGSFVEKKVTGRVPAFSYSGSTKPSEIKLAWVLEKHPGIILNLLKKMSKRLGSNTNKLKDLIEGTIRLELQLLREEQKNKASLFLPSQLNEGISILEKELDGRWEIGDDGKLLTTWKFNESKHRWYPEK